MVFVGMAQLIQTQNAVMAWSVMENIVQKRVRVILNLSTGTDLDLLEQPQFLVGELQLLQTKTNIVEKCSPPKCFTLLNFSTTLDPDNIM